MDWPVRFETAGLSDVKDLKTELIQLEYRLIIKLGTIATLAIGAMAAIVKFF